MGSTPADPGDLGSQAPTNSLVNQASLRRVWEVIEVTRAELRSHLSLRLGWSYSGGGLGLGPE